jgi:hypothetical protein
MITINPCEEEGVFPNSRRTFVAIIKNQHFVRSRTLRRNVRVGSGVSFRGKLFPSLLPGVKQTKPGESGPLAVELQLSGVLRP